MTTLAYAAGDLDDMSRADMIGNLKLLREDGHNVCALNAKGDIMRDALLGMLDGVNLRTGSKPVLAEVTANVPAEIIPPSPKKEASLPVSFSLPKTKSPAEIEIPGAVFSPAPKWHASKKEPGEIERNFVGDAAMLHPRPNFLGGTPSAEEEVEVQKEGDAEASMLDASTHSAADDVLKSVLYDSEPDGEEEEVEEEDEEEEEDAMMGDGDLAMMGDADNEEMALPTPVPRRTAAAETGAQMRTHIKFDDDGEVATLQKMAASSTTATTAATDVHAQPSSWTPMKEQKDAAPRHEWTPVKDQADAQEMLDQGDAHVNEGAYRDTNDIASPQLPQQTEWAGTHTYFGEDDDTVLESTAVAAADRAAAEEASPNPCRGTQSSEVDDIFNALTL